ncbi:sulfate transporter family-domain-containing protein [Jimgerdemannia flammicorona]|uniref:Sulfate transporter family-domain-containing protein n=1 Tax=Jimgerdemannia flammicorona TaxID=994334 RepID=A0A433D2T5_9FUNG|nr:sulfate transporter family-domain-containing protein [Jimgerdemannia flammicorona]
MAHKIRESPVLPIAASPVANKKRANAPTSLLGDEDRGSWTEIPSRSYFSSHTHPADDIFHYSASIEAIREQTLALSSFAMSDPAATPPQNPQDPANASPDDPNFVRQQPEDYATASRPNSTQSNLSILLQTTTNNPPNIVIQDSADTAPSNRSTLLNIPGRHRSQDRRPATIDPLSSPPSEFSPLLPGSRRGQSSQHPIDRPTSPTLSVGAESDSDPPDFTDDAASTISQRGLLRGLFDQLPTLPGTTSRRGSRDYGTVADDVAQGNGQFSRGNNGNADKPYVWRWWSRQEFVTEAVVKPIGYLPAVVLGLLLNLLDAISYGLITFPLNIPIFATFGPDGISMFLVSCIASQLVYSLGGSVFKGGNGSMMIEAFQLYAPSRSRTVSSHHSRAHPFSYWRGQAPRGHRHDDHGLCSQHSVDGPGVCSFGGVQGGVGWFLVQTAIEVSSRMETPFAYDLATLRFLFLDNHHLILWTSALGAAILLRVSQKRITHPLFVPLFFMALPTAFFIVAAIAGWKIEDLRKNGWVFPLPEGDAPWWRFYTYFDPSATSWSAIAETIPAMFALTFFGLLTYRSLYPICFVVIFLITGILHVPINVPALGVSTNQNDVDTNRELVAHGVSNILSGFVGSVQSASFVFVYFLISSVAMSHADNLVSGGDSRVAGTMLAAATLIVLFIGPWIVGYIPVMVVGSLIFHLGLDLLKEALIDTWGIVHYLEYITIVAIVILMALLGFVEGILLGIIMACIFFVVQNSKRGTAIRATYTGASARSTVRRLYRQQKFLAQVAPQILVMRLQGYLFFGTIGQVEKAIRALLDRRRWDAQPIRFLVLDLALVQGIDFSAAEAFIRVRRLLRAREVYLVLCGVKNESDEGRALRNAGMWVEEGGDEFLRCFETLNEALEWCENVLLQAYYARQASWTKQQLKEKKSRGAKPEPAAKRSDATPGFDLLAHDSSPRSDGLQQAARNVLPEPSAFQTGANLAQPLALLLQIFGELSSTAGAAAAPDQDFYFHLGSYFSCQEINTGTVIWQQGGDADCLYLVEQGLLRSTVEFDAEEEGEEEGDTNANKKALRRTRSVASITRTTTVESILPGTVVGELGLFTGKSRTSTLTSDKKSVVWRLDRDVYERMSREEPLVALRFTRLALNFSAERLGVVTSYAFHLA